MMRLWSSIISVIKQEIMPSLLFKVNLESRIGFKASIARSAVIR